MIGSQVRVVRARQMLGVLLLGTLAIGPAGDMWAGPLGANMRAAPLWDGETAAAPDGLLVNRYGGPPIHMGDTKTRLLHVTDNVHSGTGALRIETLETIPAGGFGFFQTALTGFGPSPAYLTSRDVTRFGETSFWLDNKTGGSFTLKFEIKDYRDSGAHLAYWTHPISSAPGWREVGIPLSLDSPGWTVVGSPDLARAKLFGFVIDANRGQPVAGSIYLDDMVLTEPGTPLDPHTASLRDLVEGLARRQFDGLWGSRNQANGLIPTSSVSAVVGALNTTSAMLKMLPGAVDRGWIDPATADAYVTQLVGTLNTVMDNAHYVPPRYFDWVTLAPVGAAEESSVDAAFMFLALYQYKSLHNTNPALRTAIDSLQNRFNFAAFSDTQGSPQGWKLAYQYQPGDFTAGTYDGYSGEPWLISLAAQLAESNHVPIATHFHSGVLREQDHLVDPALAHLVHTMPEWRAAFLQWLLPLFVDVSQRGIDTYPIRELATNPWRNAIRYQKETDARLADLGRPLLLQPDAGDDGSGAYYRQFSLYDDHDRPDLFMPWSVAFSLLGDPTAAEAALRNHLAAGLHGPLGLSDSVRWPTSAAAPDQITARHDFWNTALSTMALIEYLYHDNQRFTALPEVAATLDEVFLPLGDMDLNGSLDFDDIDDFVRGLNRASNYETLFGLPPSFQGDMDLDGDLDFDDIPAFVGRLVAATTEAGSVSVPEPSAVWLGIAAVLTIGVHHKGVRSIY